MDHKQNAHELLDRLQGDPVQPLSTMLRHELAVAIAEATAEAEVVGFQTANLKPLDDPGKHELEVQLANTVAQVTQLRGGFQSIATAIEEGGASAASILDFCRRMTGL